MAEQTKRSILIGLIITSLFPALFLLTPPATSALTDWSIYASSVVGYMALVLFLWMYILGTKSVTSLFFKDLAPVLNIHKWLGKYGTLIILIHPMLIIYGYGESLFYSSIPNISTSYERYVTLGRIAFWSFISTWVISALLRDRIAFRPWKYTHYLTYIIVPFALLHAVNLGVQTQTNMLVKGYLYLLAATFVIFVFLRLRTILNLDKSLYHITRIQRLTELDTAYTLSHRAGTAFTPQRGQYVYIKLGYLSEDHPFSVAGFNKKTGEITVVARTEGMYTREMTMLSKGEDVYLSGPFGSFTNELAPDDPTPVVYITGGIGITPFVERILEEHTAREQWLFAANRNLDTAVLTEPLKRTLGDRCVRIHSQKQGEAVPGEETGFITAELIKKYLKNPRSYQYYLCGPPPMMEAVRGVMNELGVPKDSVHTEQFGW